MFRSTCSALLLAAMLGALMLQSSARSQEVPPGHPEIPQQVPPGHPPIPQQPGAQPGAQPGQPPAADPEDIASVDAVINAYYDVISGPAGEERDWDRFRSLFIPDARLITSKAVQGRAAALKLTPEQFIQANKTYFERGGYFEREIHRSVDTFGKIAQAFSTYESRHKEDDPNPYSRGLNGIQLISNGEHWWIATIMWDFELPDENPIPDRYLPKLEPSAKAGQATEGS